MSKAKRKAKRRPAPLRPIQYRVIATDTVGGGSPGVTITRTRGMLLYGPHAGRQCMHSVRRGPSPLDYEDDFVMLDRNVQ